MYPIKHTHDQIRCIWAASVVSVSFGIRVKHTCRWALHDLCRCSCSRWCKNIRIFIWEHLIKRCHLCLNESSCICSVDWCESSPHLQHLHHFCFLYKKLSQTSNHNVCGLSLQDATRQCVLLLIVLLLSLNQSMVLLLHSQHQYIFDYDSVDRLSAVTMPSVARHTMQTIRSIGYYRNIYTPPESNASVTVDYSEDGQVRFVFSK